VTHVKLYILTIDLILLTDGQTADPSSRQRGSPPKDKTVAVKQYLLSGHEPQTGLDTKTDRLTERQSQCDSDSDSDCLGGCQAFDPSSDKIAVVAGATEY
jgi:hypothetical protein